MNPRRSPHSSRFPQRSGEALSPAAEHCAESFGTVPEPVDAKQVAIIVKRLCVLLGEGLENARRCGAELPPAQMVRVCDELLREAREPGYRPDFGGSVEGFLLSGLFDELVQQPSNIFDTVTSADGRQYYVPLLPETWIACLETLRLSLLPHG